MAVILDNVRSRVVTLTPGKQGWTTHPVALPDNAAIDLATATDRSDDLYVTVTSFITPTTLWSIDAATGKTAQVKFIEGPSTIY